MNWQEVLQEISSGEIKTIARAISLVENEFPGYEALLRLLPNTSKAKTIGITGPPGAGKSTLVDALIEVLVNQGHKIAVLCVDPSSPFNLGAVLGDRIRMSEWYTHPDVFIRSLASRGSLGGLHPRIIEITDILKASVFDYIIIETVGVGQSEIEIAGLADTTVVVVVPEAGDEIQTMKAGLMEIADLFVVNKADRPGANAFVKNLQQMLSPAFSRNKEKIEIIKTIASGKVGIIEMMQAIQQCLQNATQSDKRNWLLSEKAYQLIKTQRMRDINKQQLKLLIEKDSLSKDFNLYRLVAQFSQQP